MSYDIDEDGNKVFYEPELEREQSIQSYVVHYSGSVYVEAVDEHDAIDKFMSLEGLEPDDITAVRE